MRRDAVQRAVERKRYVLAQEVENLKAQVEAYEPNNAALRAWLARASQALERHNAAHAKGDDADEASSSRVSKVLGTRPAPQGVTRHVEISVWI
jgi:hypothetical protein